MPSSHLPASVTRPSLHRYIDPSIHRPSSHGDPEAMEPCSGYQDLTTVPAPAPGPRMGALAVPSSFFFLACRPWQLHMAPASTTNMTRLRCDMWFSPADKFQLLLSRLSSSTERRDTFCQHTRWVRVVFTIPCPAYLGIDQTWASQAPKSRNIARCTCSEPWVPREHPRLRLQLLQYLSSLPAPFSQNFRTGLLGSPRPASGGHKTSTAPRIK